MYSNPSPAKERSSFHRPGKLSAEKLELPQFFLTADPSVIFPGFLTLQQMKIDPLNRLLTIN